MKRRVSYIIAFIIVVALVAALINGFVQDSSILSSLRFMFGHALSSRHYWQSLIWIAIVFIGVNLAIQSLLAGRKRKRIVAQDKREFSGRIAAVSTWVQRVDEDSFFQWRVARHIATIAREAIGHSQTLTPQELEAVLTDGSIDPEVAHYLRKGLAVRSDKLDIKQFGERVQENWLSGLYHGANHCFSRTRPHQNHRISGSRAGGSS